jgi:plasmid maintenance system antidote protein VapI
MSRIVGSVNRKPQASTQQHSTDDQRGLGLIGAIRTSPVEADADFIRRSSWDGTMRYAVQRSGMDDYEVADEMHVSHGHMSKVMKGAAGLWGPRLVKFMRVTGSVAPLQWLADQMGYEVRPKAPSQRIAELEAELERERERARRQG